eukprot:2093952-Rhodomonas_salina.1
MGGLREEVSRLEGELLEARETLEHGAGGLSQEQVDAQLEDMKRTHAAEIVCSSSWVCGTCAGRD